MKKQKQPASLGHQGTWPCGLDPQHRAKGALLPVPLPSLSLLQGAGAGNWPKGELMDTAPPGYKGAEGSGRTGGWEGCAGAQVARAEWASGPVPVGWGLPVGAETATKFKVDLQDRPTGLRKGRWDPI